MSKFPAIMLLAFAITACAATPNSQLWKGSKNVSHIPLQGLKSPPEIVATATPVNLVNFNNKAERDAASAAGAAKGAASGAAEWCLYGFILCPVTAIVGAIYEGSKGTLSSISQEQDDELARYFKQRATNSKIGESISERVPASNGDQFPQLKVNETTVVLIPGNRGVSFFLIVEVQGIPEVGDTWEPTRHVFQSWSYSAQAWLSNDGELLMKTINRASSILSEEIVSIYHPY